MTVDEDYGTAAAAVDCLSHHSFAIRQEEGSNHICCRGLWLNVEKAILHDILFSTSMLKRPSSMLSLCRPSWSPLIPPQI